MHKNLQSSSICVIFLNDYTEFNTSYEYIYVEYLFLSMDVCVCVHACMNVFWYVTHMEIPRFHQHLYENLIFSN